MDAARFMDLCTGIASLVLGLQLVYLHHRRTEFSLTLVYRVICVLLFAAAAFFLIGFFYSKIPEEVESAVRRDFLPVILMVGALWLAQAIHRIRRLPTLEDVHESNQALLLEIQQRRQAEEKLQQGHAELERRIAERTIAHLEVHAEMSRAKQSLEALINASPLPIMAVDSQSRISLWNPASERLFGWSQVEALGQRNPVIPADHWDEHRQLVDATMRGANVSGMETKRCTKDGRLIDVFIWNAPFHSSYKNHSNDGPSETMQCLAIFEDITEKKAAALALQEAKQIAEQASVAKTFFLANMSHEVRTPLSVILGFAELLKLDCAADPRALQRVESIRRSGQLLSSLINDILDVARIEAGEIRVESSEINIREVLEDVMTMFSLKAMEKQLIFNIVTPDELPEQMTVDAMRLKQMLINLVGNAIKFTDQGHVTLTVEHQAGTSESDRRFIFTVEDTGRGMRPQQVEALFKPFSQAHADLTRTGSGLGLYLSKKIALALGGDVVLRNTEPGAGSCFQITMPAISGVADA